MFGNINFDKNEEMKRSHDSDPGLNKNDKSFEKNKEDLVTNLNVLREFLNLHHSDMGLNEFLRKIYVGQAFERYFRSLTNSSSHSDTCCKDGGKNPCNFHRSGT